MLQKVRIRFKSRATHPTFPIGPKARDHRGPFSFTDQHFILTDSAIKPFCDSKIGFPTPTKMPSALDCVPRRFSTKAFVYGAQLRPCVHSSERFLRRVFSRF